ncbi:MAG: hypothetical protein KDM81_18365, partial [Verrucomicrobiae bacterium]|nr:hypothetical protein [Verrucomicrobiae bacterium]
FVMEKRHKRLIVREFQPELVGKEVVCLFIRDIYNAMEERLIAVLRKKLAPHLLLPRPETNDACTDEPMGSAV